MGIASWGGGGGGSGGSNGGGGGHHNNRPYKKGLLIIIGLSLVLLMYSQQLETQEGGHNRIKIKGLLLHLPFKGLEENEDDSSFLVHTGACKLRHMDPFHSSVDEFLRDSAIPRCSQALVTLKEGNNTLKIDGGLLTHWKYKGASCCFRAIWRKQQDSDKYDEDADYGVELATNCTKIPAGPDGVSVPGRVQYVKVECQNNLGVKVWQDFFPLIQPPQVFSEGTEKKVKFWRDQVVTAAGSKNNKYNNSNMSFSTPNPTLPPLLPPSVLVIGIDSISRLHMIRSLPRTRELLRAEGFVEMQGYTKVGDNTFPNIMAAFAGMTDTETVKTCWPTRQTKLDNCPFLWQNFSRENYITAHVEDSPGIAIFNYDKTGFVKPPADYYIRPLMVAEHKAAKNRHRFGGSSDCLGGGLTPTRVMLRYIHSFVKEVGGVAPFFLLSWFTSVAHDDFNGLKPYDPDFRTFLTSILSMVGDNTLILFISDHGYRFGPFRETFLGFYEESLPFFYIRLPPSLKTRFPSWYTSLRINSARLTSPHDLYATLVQLLDQVVKVKGHIDVKKSHNNKATSPTPHGTSFLQVGPLNRTCETSAIPQKYCMCGVSPNLATSTKLASELGEFIVAQINSDLLYHNLTSDVCVPLSYSKFLYGRQVGEGEVWNGVGKLEPYTDLLIALETEPWEGRFEGRVRLRGGDDDSLKRKELLDSVGRINAYAGKSDCISDYKMKNYCTCKKLWEVENKKRKDKEQAKLNKKRKKKKKKG